MPCWESGVHRARVKGWVQPGWLPCAAWYPAHRQRSATLADGVSDPEAEGGGQGWGPSCPPYSQAELAGALWQ